MRKIKFRGKDIENDNQWRYGSLLSYPDGRQAIVTWDTDGNELSYDVDPDTVGQYIGRKDTNGSEVYEGDVLGYYERYPLLVEYREDALAFHIANKAMPIGRYPFRPDWMEKCAKEFVVIGNIHDEPGLEKKKRVLPKRK